MTRLHSYFTYVPVILIPLAAIVLPIVIFAASTNIPWTLMIFYFPAFICWGYLLYHMKRVYYGNDELLIGNLFSKKLNAIKKDRFGSIEPAYRIGTYKIIYYDDADSVKY